MRKDNKPNVRNKRKILWYLWTYTLGGGAEKILATIVNHLPDTYEQTVLEIDHFDQPAVNFRHEVKRLAPLQDKGSSNRLIGAFYWRLRQWFPYMVRRYLVKDIYDIEVSFTVMNPPLPFSRRSDVLKIAWIHGSVENFLYQKRYFKAYRKFLLTADKIVAISQRTAQSIIQVFPEVKDKIHLIYNGYDLENFRQRALVAVETTIEPLSFAVIGRIEEAKGSNRVIDIIQQLHHLGYRYHVYFIGTGILAQSLQDKVKHLNLEKYVHFLGYQDDPLPYLKQVRLLVSMSLQEGFPGVFVEALALGKPIVSTRVGGVDELLPNKTFGSVIESDDEAVRAIIYYMEETELLSDNQVQQHLSPYSIATQMKKIEALFSE